METEFVVSVIVGMSIVTAVPRVLPFLMDIEKYLPPYVVLGLRFVPVAALTALVIPGIFYVGESPLIGFAAGLVATVLSLLPRNNVVFTMAAAILTYLGVSNLL